MVNFVGRNQSLALFSNGTEAVVVNTDYNLVVGVGDAAALSNLHEWTETNEIFSDATLELASGAVTSLDINVITASGRMYTVPDGVKAEAKKALEWHKEHHRGGTPVGLNSARTLARGGQIGIEKIRHIAKYFPRHEVDKKGKGWKTGDDQFPSNGRIAWALWGGDAAWRWAKAIVERENKKAVTAGGYALSGYQETPETYNTDKDYSADLNPFKDAMELDGNGGPEFMARVRMDGSGIDRLYMVDMDGNVKVWDDGCWDSLGHVDGDIWSYDNALDDQYDHCDKDHFIIDPESAIHISARLQQNPFGRVSIEELDPEESHVVSQGMMGEDWDMVDYALTAAGDSFTGTKGAKPEGEAGDGKYTTEERSAIASRAARDALGQYAKVGGRAVVGNDAGIGAGTIVAKSASVGGNVLFKSDKTGKTIDIPAKYTTPEDKFKGQNSSVKFGAPLDVSGILGQPRTPNSMPGAQLPGTLPPMTKGGLQSVLNDWNGYVADQRASFKPFTDSQVRDYAKDTKQNVKGANGTSITVATPEGKLSTQKATPEAPQQKVAPAAQGEAPAPAPAAPAAEGPVAQAQGLSKPVPAPTPINPLVPDPTTAPFTFVKPAAPSGPVPGGPATPRQADGPDNKPRFGDSNRDNLKPAPAPAGPSNPRQADGPVVKPTDPRNAPGSNASPKSTPKFGDSNRDSLKPAPDSRNAPGSNASPKPKPSGPANPRQADGPDGKPKPKPNGPATPRQADGPDGGPSKGPKSAFDKDGKYVVQKGDSLWSIAEKNKPKGETTASYWAKVMKANPKGQFKSGNASLIYSGERVNLPGVNAPSTSPGAPKPKAPKPGAPKSGDENRDNLKPKVAPKFGDDNRDNLKPKTAPKPAAPKSGDENRDSLKPKVSPKSGDENRDNLKPKPDSRNAPGSNKPSSGDSRNAPGSNKSPKKPVPKSGDENRDSLKPKVLPNPVIGKPVKDAFPGGFTPKAPSYKPDPKNPKPGKEIKPPAGGPKIPKSLTTPPAPAKPGPTQPIGRSGDENRDSVKSKPLPKPVIGKPVTSKPSVLDGIIKKSGKAGARKRK